MCNINGIYKNCSDNTYYDQYGNHIKCYNIINPAYIKDYGLNPFAINISKATKQNDNFCIVLWTGQYLQITY